MSNAQFPARETTWKSLINAIERHEDLTYDESAWAMKEMMTGVADPVQVAAFLVGLHTKGESAEELHGLSEQMLSMAEKYQGPHDAVDIVGTGGDQHNTVNISTMASLVIAGTGLKVVKHGNRASSSSTGSADALERLGLPLDAPADRVEASVDEVGISFLFANTYHPAMRYIGPIRKTLGVPTVFNFLGPLANPARVNSSVIGVSSLRIAPLMADVFARRGQHALVFTGPLNLDELSLIGPTQMWEAYDGDIQESVIEVADLNLPSNTLADITGKDPEFNADVIRRVISGEKGSIRDTVVLNAAAGLVAASNEVTRPLAERLNDAMVVAEESLDSGRAHQVLTDWIAFLQA